MKIVIYNDSFEVLEVAEEVVDPQVEGKNVTWKFGELIGIKHNFILVDDSVEVGLTTEDILQFDQKTRHVKIDLFKENKDLKERLQATEDALLFLLMQ